MSRWRSSTKYLSAPTPPPKKNERKVITTEIRCLWRIINAARRDQRKDTIRGKGYSNTSRRQQAKWVGHVTQPPPESKPQKAFTLRNIGNRGEGPPTSEVEGENDRNLKCSILWSKSPSPIATSACLLNIERYRRKEMRQDKARLFAIRLTYFLTCFSYATF